ncbi:outer membrane protein [Nitrospira moscoviensis]|uniref:Uncharacterized protein n=1 Tax=Nitrospira moscoviensis TaxID=42253 RepID=A0A0K2GJN6_NITMO|nr:outer membrane beta-barrel protein [Nitrospira moscoviensis]ALA61168.1 exported protein of unknown function [Nitrospira moscoviensis]
MFPRLRGACRFLILATLLTFTAVLPAHAEWYVAGYGGLTTGGDIRNVTMPDYGLRLAQIQFPSVLNPVTGDSLTQNFKASDLSLSNSLLFGAKAGYFFSDQGLSWLGVELDAFTSKPDIKRTTVSTAHDITFVPGDTTECFNLGTRCPQTVNNKGTLNVEETSLRVTVVSANVIVRYPGAFLQPYVGAGAGAFYFQSSSGTFQGRQIVPGLNVLAGLKLLVSDEWGLFAEGRYNLANLSNFDPTFGLSGTYSIFHFVGGIAYHF